MASAVRSANARVRASAASPRAPGGRRAAPRRASTVAPATRRGVPQPADDDPTWRDRLGSLKSNGPDGPVGRRNRGPRRKIKQTISSSPDSKPTANSNDARVAAWRAENPEDAAVSARRREDETKPEKTSSSGSASVWITGGEPETERYSFFRASTARYPAYATRATETSYEDSPLVEAARRGQALLLDEADKAPTEVVVVLKSLVEDGRMRLADGRQLLAPALLPARGGGGAPDPRVIPIHPDFKLFVLANRPGWPFLGNDLLDDSQTIQKLYAEQAYIHARARFEVIYDRERKLLDIIYTVNEGPRVKVERILVEGNEKTNQKVIRRQLSLYPGDLFDGKLLEESLGRLGRLRYFDDVRLDFRPGSKPDSEDLVLQVKEARTGSFIIGGGVSTNAGFFANLSLNQRNFDIFSPPKSVEDIIEGRAFTGAGQNFSISAQPGRQHAGAEGIRRGQPQQVARRRAAGTQQIADPAQRKRRFSRRFDHVCAIRPEPIALLRAFENLGAMRVFESRDSAQNRCMVDPEPPCRAADRAGFGHRQHEFQVIPIVVVHECAPVSQGFGICL